MTRKHLIFAGILPLALALATTACACLWDSDTLQMERLRFPGVLEIITGKFVRHSRAYYEWRIKDRLKKLAAKPGDPALIDDLAVGYDKLGRLRRRHRGPGKIARRRSGPLRNTRQPRHAPLPRRPPRRKQAARPAGPGTQSQRALWAGEVSAFADGIRAAE